MRRDAWLAAGLSFGFLLAVSERAHAEVTLVKPVDGWEFYTSGRVGSFAEYVNGTGIPVGNLRPDGSRNTVAQEGISLDADPDAAGNKAAGHASVYKVRSGFLGNVLSFGLRRKLSDDTTVSGVTSIWSTVESGSQQAYLKEIPDVREAYLKVEGPAGSLLVGRGLTLFGRGATEIDFLYGHGFGVGAPQSFNSVGPAAGHIGFGVLANIFAAGVVYTTPKLAGLQLTVGYFDPTVLVGVQFARTKLGRPEAEASYDVNFGDKGKLHLFVDGAVQKVYDDNGGTGSETVSGAQAGGRLEVGPFHVGVAGFTGTGLGVNYFLSQSDSLTNKVTNRLRPIDGAYVQTQLVVDQFNFNLGWGITRAHQMTEDLLPDSANFSYLKSEQGVSAVIVYHFTSYLHGALDYFRADSKWWGGESQGVNSFNAGATVTW